MTASVYHMHLNDCEWFSLFYPNMLDTNPSQIESQSISQNPLLILPQVLGKDILYNYEATIPISTFPYPSSIKHSALPVI